MLFSHTHARDLEFVLGRASAPKAASEWLRRSHQMMITIVQLAERDLLRKIRSRPSRHKRLGTSL